MLGIQLVLLLALFIFTLVVRRRVRNDEAAAVAEVGVGEDGRMGGGVYGFRGYESSGVVTGERVGEVGGFEEYEEMGVEVSGAGTGRYECAVCCAPTSTRCSRCKGARYCSSKCQIIHWRQGHKYECHPPGPSAFEEDELNANGETLEQFATSSSNYVEGLHETSKKSSASQMHHEIPDSDNRMPRLSTATDDPLHFASRPISLGKNERSVLDVNNAPTMVREKVQKNEVDVNASLDSASSGLVNSAKKLNREKSSRRKSNASNPDLSFKKQNSSEGAVSGGLHRSKSKDVPGVEVLQNAGRLHSQTNKQVEVKSFPNMHSGNSSLRVKSDSSPSNLPRNGLKSSLLKVVDHIKTSHQKKPSLRDNLLETQGNHNRKALFQYDTFLKLYSSHEIELKPFGLINCGNSCYANAVLQCLAYTRPLTKYLLEGLHSKECWKEEWCFICEFENLIQLARKGHTPLSPIRILSNISHLGHGREEDAHEFLRYAVDTMQSICVELGGFVGPVAEETTIVGMTFGGYLHSKIKCMKCHSKSEKYERIMDLTVEIDGDIQTLEQALKRFTAYEILEGNNKYLCSRCKSYEKAKKKLTVFQAPNILTVVLKRFQAGNFTKLNKLIQFPHMLNINPYMTHSSDRYPVYSLYAVVVHLDVMTASFSGHYVCYVKNYREEWFKIDDSVVISVDLDRVLSEEAYILLYVRHSPSPPASVKIVSDSKLAEAVPASRGGKSTMPKARHSRSDATADPVVMQRQSSRNVCANDPSYLEEWVTHSVESIPRVNSSSEVSSLFSCSEEGTCSTMSTIDSASVEGYSDYIFGRGSAAGS